jgi:hypothetical protein
VLNSSQAQKKQAELGQLKSSLRTAHTSGETLADQLAAAKANSVFNRHRLFALGKEATATQAFIAELPKRVGVL